MLLIVRTKRSGMHRNLITIFAVHNRKRFGNYDGRILLREYVHEPRGNKLLVIQTNRAPTACFFRVRAFNLLLTFGVCGLCASVALSSTTHHVLATTISWCAHEFASHTESTLRGSCNTHKTCSKLFGWLVGRPNWWCCWRIFDAIESIRMYRVTISSIVRTHDWYKVDIHIV